MSTPIIFTETKTCIGPNPHSIRVNETPKRILVACHEIVVSGGLLRFDRVAAVLRSWGHKLSFVTLAKIPYQRRPTEVPLSQGSSLDSSELLGLCCVYERVSASSRHIS
jgi:hypothetical protein